MTDTSDDPLLRVRDLRPPVHGDQSAQQLSAASQGCALHSCSMSAVVPGAQSPLSSPQSRARHCLPPPHSLLQLDHWLRSGSARGGWGAARLVQRPGP